MIIETLVTTLNADRTVNLAPMGPHLEKDWEQFELRPFESTLTFANLKRTGQGIVHIADDVGWVARAVAGTAIDPQEFEPGRKVDVPALRHACRWYEFRVESITELSPRVQIRCRTVFEQRNRDFIGFNRAKHAVLEAAILATRLSFLPIEEVVDQFRRFETIIDKTGGVQEKEAFQLLKQMLRESCNP